MKRFLLTTVAFGALAVPAMAADMAPAPRPVYKAPMPVPVCMWCGFYIGVNAGYGWGNDGNINFNPSGTQNGVFVDGPAQLAAQLAGLGPLGTTGKGFLGGGQIGYNYQSGQLVWGIETDFDGAHISGSGVGSANVPVAGFPPFGVQTSTVGSQSLDTFGTLRGRLGYTPWNQSLFYATGGLAYGKATSSVGISQIETGAGATDTFTSSAGSASKYLVGWTVGAGWEWAFAPNWSVKAEYLYYDLGNLNYSANTITGISGGGVPFSTVGVAPSTEFKGSIFRLGLNWKLGGLGYGF